MSKKLAMISGITGQDGYYLARLLLEKNYRVIGLKRRGGGANLAKSTLKKQGILEHIEIMDFDFADFEGICEIFKQNNIDEFYNLAAQSFVATSFENPLFTVSVNGMGVAYILEAIRLFSPKTKFYQASTSEMFGKAQEFPQSEKTAFYPRSPYACGKVFSHYMSVNYRESFGIFACCGILFNHESPFRGKDFITRKISSGMARLSLAKAKSSKSLKNALSDTPIELGNLNACRDFGFAGDYVEGMYAMMQQATPDTYVLATGQTHSIRDFATMAGKCAGFEIVWQGDGLDEVGVDSKSGKVLVKVNPRFFRPVDVDMVVGDASKARKMLNWRPKVTFDGIVEMMVKADIKELLGFNA